MARISSVTLHQVTRRSEGNKDTAEISQKLKGLASTISRCDHMGAVSTHRIWGAARTFRWHLSFPNYPISTVLCCLSLGEWAFQKLTVFYGVLLNISWNFPGQILTCSLSFQTAEKWHSTGHGSTTFSTPRSLTSYLAFHMHPPWKIGRKKGRGQRSSTVGKLKSIDK